MEREREKRDWCGRSYDVMFTWWCWNLKTLYSFLVLRAVNSIQRVCGGFPYKGPMLPTQRVSDTNPDSKIHWANMGPIWGRQDPGGPHVGPMNFAIDWQALVLSLLSAWRNFSTNSLSANDANRFNTRVTVLLCLVFQLGQGGEGQWYMDRPLLTSTVIDAQNYRFVQLDSEGLAQWTYRDNAGES